MVIAWVISWDFENVSVSGIQNPMKFLLVIDQVHLIGILVFGLNFGQGNIT